ncbi:MAG: hypothetical protein INR71_16245 [Terriglobus roseus]|nr:hypothetical protein [Terriglobus roseus]
MIVPGASEGSQLLPLCPPVSRSRSASIRSHDHGQVQEHLPPGISLVSAENFEIWLMDIKVLDDNPLYRDQTYRLKFHFSQAYPIGACCPSDRRITPASNVSQHRSSSTSPPITDHGSPHH